MDQYSPIAHLYDSLYGAGLSGDLEWYCSELGDRPCRVLEVGCGTGRISVELARRGHDVVGIDLSKEMIRLAEARFRDGSRKVRGRLKLVFGGLLEIQTENDFDAVLAPFNVFNECLSEVGLTDLLRSIGVKLRLAGRLVAHVVWYPPTAWNGLETRVIRSRARILSGDTGPGGQCAIECDLFWPRQDRMSRLIVVEPTVEEAGGAAVYHTIRRRYWPEDHLADLLGRVGLEVDLDLENREVIEECSWHSDVAGVGSRKLRAWRGRRPAPP